MKFMNCYGNNLVNKIKNKKIVCFPCSQVIPKAIEEHNLSEAVAFFIDNNKYKNNEGININGKQFKVYSAEMLKNISASEYIILLSGSYSIEIWEQLNKIEELKDMNVYIYELFLKETTDEEFYYKKLIDPVIEKYRDVLLDKKISEEERKSLILEKENYIKQKDILVIPNVIFILSNVCSLKCKHCSMLMPYFEKPFFIELDKVLKDMEIFLSAVDECIEVNLIGGEALLYPHLDKVLEWLIENDKVMRISFGTNATITPNEKIINLLKNDKILVYISDYGYLEKLAKLVELFETNDIKFSLSTNLKWVNAGGTEYRNKDIDVLKLEYSNCFVSRLCKAIAFGKMHACERSARMLHMGAYESDNDYVELNENDSIEVLKEKIKKMYLLDYMDACNHCDYAIFPKRLIEAGEQICENEKNKKSSYTILKRDEYEKLTNNNIK